MPVTAERRRGQTRGRRFSHGEGVTLSFPGGEKREVAVQLVDLSEWGLGVQSSEPLPVGARVVASGQILSGSSAIGQRRYVRVVHCRSDDNAYSCGLAFDDIHSASEEKQQQQQERPPSQPTPPPDVDSSFVDHYETLQISANADSDTIQRVYRMLAQRFHPDNTETGDEAAFRTVLQAFHVLSDPEQRAAYDVHYRASRTLRWKIFDQPSAARGIKGEQQTRRGILALLYTKRLEQPDKPGIIIRDMEALLGCPREHLDFSLWYLKSKSLVFATDNGRYEITAEGVDSFQEAELGNLGTSSQLLLEAAAASPPKGTNGNR
jgi:DnaJ domain/PilZ domain